MKKNLLSGIIVASIVALTALNLDMGVGSRWFSGVSLATIEGMADTEADAVKDSQRLESYLCRELPEWTNTGMGSTMVTHQKICETFTRYASTCLRSQEISCPNQDIDTGVGSGWYN